MLTLRQLHLTIGLIGLLAFILTGQYMQWALGSLQLLPDGPRLFFRSVHIYLLWSSLLNLALGCYFSPIRMGWLKILQRLASLLIVIGPPLFCISFFFEPYTPELTRPLSNWANYSGFAGGILLLVARKLQDHFDKSPVEKS